MSACCQEGCPTCLYAQATPTWTSSNRTGTGTALSASTTGTTGLAVAAQTLVSNPVPCCHRSHQVVEVGLMAAATDHQGPVQEDRPGLEVHRNRHRPSLAGSFPVDSCSDGLAYCNLDRPCHLAGGGVLEAERSRRQEAGSVALVEPCRVASCHQEGRPLGAPCWVAGRPEVPCREALMVDQSRRPQRCL